jgi:hypothetical protein
VREWLAGTGGLPGETRHYVSVVTGSPAEDWIDGKDQAPPSPASCRELIALLKQAPSPFVEELEKRVNLVAAAPWGVQLSAGFSRNRALASYARLSQRYQRVLGTHDPSLLRTTLRSRGSRPFYQVRVGADTREAANDLCAQIRRAGGPCMVLRNPQG